MVTPALLIARHPEFQDVDLALIALAIGEAEDALDATVIPATVIDRATTLLACDLLARSPHALPLTLIRADGRSVYLDELDQITVVHGRAYRLEGF